MKLELERESDTQYYFLCYDTGTGLAPHHLSCIFERFFRPEDGRTRATDTGGTGLGLSIVRNAVRFHYGEITACNRPGAGLQFNFSLAK
jgi:signal transduction histidine kinase